MTTFDDLVDDLKKENLLDEFAFVSANLKKHLDGVQLSANGNESVATFNDSNPELPTADLTQATNNFQTIENIKVNSVFEQPSSPYYSVNSFHKTQNLIRYKTRKRSKKESTGYKFCKACEVSVPFFSLKCYRCHGRVIGDLSYYTLWIFSAVIFMLFVLLIVSSKTYK